MDELSSTEVPIAALTQISRDKLSLMLNGQKVIPSDDGLPRDWRGVAQSLQCDSETLQEVGRAASPTEALLERCRVQPVSALWCALRLVGRIDVQDDSRHMIAADVARYQERLSATVPSSSAVPPGADVSDADLLCVGDAECLRSGQPLPIFDAFLLYDDSDEQFAQQIIERMEARGIKLCDKERHLLPGVTFEHQGIIRLMESRCHRVLVILSPRFLDSAVNKFLAMFAQALGLDKRGRTLLPCVYQKCTLPSYLMYCSRIDFTRGVGLVNSWDKMYETLSVGIASRTRSVSYSAVEARPAAVPARPRTDSTPCDATPDAARAEPRAAAGAGGGLLGRWRGRRRGVEPPAELELTSDGRKVAVQTEPIPAPPLRDQLAKLFNNSKNKVKRKAEKKKVALAT